MSRHGPAMPQGARLVRDDLTDLVAVVIGEDWLSWKEEVRMRVVLERDAGTLHRCCN